MKKLLFLAISTVVFWGATSHGMVILDILNPTKCIRGTGSPIMQVFPFSSDIGGPAIIKLNNGSLENSSIKRVSSAIIKLNSQIIFGPSEFNQNVRTIEKQIRLKKGGNSLVVELRGNPGGEITVQIIQPITNLRVIPSSVALGEPGSQLSLKVMGNLSDGTEVEITGSIFGTAYSSGNPDIATVTDGGIVTAVALGQTTVTVTNDDFLANVPVAVQGASPTLVDLGTVLVGSAPIITPAVSVCETGGVVPLEVSTVVLAGSAAYTWEWAGDAQTLPRFILPGTCATINVIFTPNVNVGCVPQDATLSMTHNGDGEGGPVITTIDFTATVTGPDLEGRWTSFSSDDEDNMVRGVLRIANMGIVDLTDTIVDPVKQYFRVSFYLSSDANLDATDEFLYWQDVYYLLEVGHAKDIGFNFTFTGSQKGKYIIAVIDSENNFFECNDFVGLIPPLPPSAENPDPLPAYFPFPPGNLNINNIVVPAKELQGGAIPFPIP